jgi:predicted PurR-regulated permease PerM
MKSQYFIAILFATSLYWMYLLYEPFLMVMTIAALLAISTASINYYFENMFSSRLLGAFVSSLLLAVLFFAPLGYFLATLTIKLNHLEPNTLKNIELYINSFIANPPKFLLFLKPYLLDSLNGIDINSLTANALHIAGKVGTFSASFVKNAFLVIIFYFFALYNGSHVVEFLKRAVQMSVEESTLLAR